MQRLDKILEKWATLYKPLSHRMEKEAKHKTFYRVNTIGENNAFMRNSNTAISPSMAYSTIVDAELTERNNKVIDYRHVVYFMIKDTGRGISQTYIAGDDEAFDLKCEADGMVQDLIAFLLLLKQSAAAGAKELVLSEKTVENKTSGTVKKERTVFPITADVKFAIQGLDIESVEWSSVPVVRNGWWIIGLQFSCKESRKLCITPERYA